MTYEEAELISGGAMIYLVRYHPAAPPDIAACETGTRAACLEAQGYSRCSRDEFSEAWRARNIMDRLRLEDAAPQPLPQPAPAQGGPAHDPGPNVALGMAKKVVAHIGL